MASAPAQTPDKQNAKLKKSVAEAWSKGRAQILPALASSLIGNCGNEWVPALELFEEWTLHGICIRDIFKSLWIARSVTLESRGAFAYIFEQNCHILIRWKSASTWFLLGCRKNRTSRDDLDQYIRFAMSPSNLPGTGKPAVSKQILGPIVSTALLTVSHRIKALQAEAASSLALVTPGSARTSRNDVLTTNVQKASNPLQILELLGRKERTNVMHKLAAKANVYDQHLVNIVQEERTALVLLEMFKGDISRQALVERLLSSKEVQDSGLLFPRAFQFDLLSESSQSNIVHVMTAIAIGAAKKLLPNDAEEGASALLKRMTENTTFKRFALPNLSDGGSEESYRVNSPQTEKERRLNSRREKLKRLKRLKKTRNQSKMRGLHISVRPAERATNEKVTSLDMSAHLLQPPTAATRTMATRLSLSRSRTLLL
jgi:hypothetical protein